MNDQIKAYITKFLNLMQERIPMSPARHNLTIGDDGVLQANFIIGEYWHYWKFDEELELTPIELVDYIIDELKEHKVL